jgi:hypothetical protein
MVKKEKRKKRSQIRRAKEVPQPGLFPSIFSLFWREQFVGPEIKLSKLHMFSLPFYA